MQDKQALHHEQMLLGCMIRDNSQIRSAGHMNEAWFRFAKHRVLFKAIKDLYGQYSRVTVLSIEQYLIATRSLGAVGGIKYILELVGKVDTALQAQRDARAVKGGVREAGGRVE